MFSVLFLCPLVLAGACVEEVAAPALGHPVEAQSQGAATLSYVCGEMFRVRNSHTRDLKVSYRAEAVAVTAREGASMVADSGMLILPPAQEEKPYKIYFVAQVPGTVTLWLDGKVIGEAANGGTECTPGAPPPFPDNGPWTPPDTLFLVQAPWNPLVWYYRRMALVEVREDIPLPDVHDLLKKHRAELVDGSPLLPTYLFFFSDPGPTWEDLQAFLSRLDQEPGVEIAAEIAAIEPPPGVHARFPADGAQHERGAWFSDTSTARWPSWAVTEVRPGAVLVRAGRRVAHHGFPR